MLSTWMRQRLPSAASCRQRRPRRLASASLCRGSARRAFGGRRCRRRHALRHGRAPAAWGWRIRPAAGRRVRRRWPRLTDRCLRRTWIRSHRSAAWRDHGKHEGTDGGNGKGGRGRHRQAICTPQRVFAWQRLARNGSGGAETRNGRSLMPCAPSLARISRLMTLEDLPANIAGAQGRQTLKEAQ